MNTIHAKSHVAAWGIVAGVALAGCSRQEPDVKYAPGYVPGRHAISVLGVFKDGRLDEVAWNELEPKLEKPLGGPCEPAYSEPLRTAEPALFDAIEQTAEQEGVTTTLLDRLAMRTKAEVILVLYEYDHAVRSARAEPSPASAPSPAAGRSSHRHQRTHTPAPAQEQERDPPFELAASLFDVRKHAFVAQVDVKPQARGGDAIVETAADRLAKSLSSLLSGSTCFQFRWQKE